MIPDQQIGKARRLKRLSRHGDGRFLFVPLDHSLSDGPIADGDAFNALVSAIVTGGADAVIVHKGRARRLQASALRSSALIVHLSASTRHGPDAEAKVLVCTVEEGVRLGADAVSVHVNIGSETEPEQLADLGAVAKDCDRWGLPLLAMVYPRGPRITNPHDPEVLAHVVNIAADLGADLVKTTWAEPFSETATVVASSPIPVLIAGGPAAGPSVESFARTILESGCQGLAIGRRVFTHSDPSSVVNTLARIVHTPASRIPTRPTRILAGSL